MMRKCTGHLAGKLTWLGLAGGGGSRSEGTVWFIVSDCSMLSGGGGRFLSAVTEWCPSVVVSRPLVDLLRGVSKDASRLLINLLRLCSLEVSLLVDLVCDLLLV